MATLLDGSQVKKVSDSYLWSDGKHSGWGGKVIHTLSPLRVLQINRVCTSGQRVLTLSLTSLIPPEVSRLRVQSGPIIESFNMFVFLSCCLHAVISLLR